MYLVTAIICGYLLDLLLGDPQGWPHPVIYIGRLISFLEKKVRGFYPEGQPQQLLQGGVFLVVVVCAASFLVPWLLLRLTDLVSPVLSFIFTTIMCYQIFATRCLRDESMKVYRQLAQDDLPAARVALSGIVGRDTEQLTAAEVTKAAVETVAENTADGVLAPMLYMFIGGAPLAMLYKGINTMDSMIGYKNDKYLYLGRCAAKLDDVANYIPARLCGLIMTLGAFLAGLDGKKAWQIFKRDRRNHLSPNSAMTESVAAGALHIQLGGTHSYFGKLVEKKTIGDNDREVEPADIPRTNRLMYVTTALGLVLFTLISWLWYGKIC
jgi:adenosylcobinamide-phosphate synthase